MSITVIIADKRNLEFPKLWIDSKGNLRAGRSHITSPKHIDKAWSEQKPRKSVTGAMLTDFYLTWKFTLTRVVEPDGRVWWQQDDGERLCNLRDIDKVRKENAEKQQDESDSFHFA